MSTQIQVSFLSRPGGEKLAYLQEKATGGNVGVTWLGGFKSDMTGTKATALAEPVLFALRLFWPRSVDRPVRRWHHQPVARRRSGCVG